VAAGFKHDTSKIQEINKDLSIKAKARTKDHNVVLKDNQGPRPRTTSLVKLWQQ